MPIFIVYSYFKVYTWNYVYKYIYLSTHIYVFNVESHVKPGLYFLCYVFLCYVKFTMFFYVKLSLVKWNDKL